MEKQILCGNGKALEVVTSSDENFSLCYSELGNEGITAEDMTMKKLAQAKLLAGDANNLWQKGSWTTNGWIYVPSGDILVTAPKYTPFLRNLDKAVAEHIAGRENYVNDEFQEIMDNAKTNPADAVKSGVLLLKRQGLRQDLETGSFGDMPVTYFLFEEIAQQYGSALGNKGIKSVRLILASEDYAKHQNRPFSRALWANDLSSDSALYGSIILNYSGGRVSGVREQWRAEHADTPEGRRGAKIPIGNAGLAELTLEEVLAIVGEYTVGPNMEALQKKLANRFRK